MNDILDEYWQYLRRKYHCENTRINNHKFAQLFLKWLQEEKHKTYRDMTPDDTKDYKAFCLEHYKINGNVGRLNGINNFVDGFLGRTELRVSAPKSVQVNKLVLSDKELEQYLNAAETPLQRLIAVYQIDGLLRPGEFAKLRISLHDVKNQMIYLDDTKTGNTSIIFTPRMIEAFTDYLRHRITPKHPEHNDALIIDKGSNYGLPILTERPDFIRRHTKKIAVQAKINRHVYPYLIKPSAITDGFNKQINPKILQRQARHRKIETTLRYDHTSDQMTKDFFNRTQKKPNTNTDILKPEDKARVWFDKLLANEIDLKTFKTGIEFLLPDKRKEEDRGYV